MPARKTVRTIRLATRFVAALGCAGTILATLVGSGCVFSPRAPEAPLASDVEWLRPSEPENVLANMKSAVEARFLTNYKDSLDESFVFTPASQDIAEAPPGYFDDDSFGKSRELAAMERLFTQVNALALSWNYGEDDITIGPAEASFELPNYELAVTYSNGDVVTYAGSALLTLVKVDGEWRLLYWDESNSSSNLSWGRLRANLDV